MEGIVDTHAHLTDGRFGGDLPEVLTRARDAGVTAIVTISTSADDSMAAVDLAARNAGVYATVGIHPHSAEEADDGAFAHLRELATRDRVVGIGETGLDYHYDNADRSRQREVFLRHVEIASELDLPVVVHARDADEDVIAVIRAAGWDRGVLHCFSGGRELMEAALDLGWYISFSGMITFARWDGADLLRAVPRDRLVIETDSPYLAPVPVRGKRNEPANVRFVAAGAAELRGEDPAELAAFTTANALALYGIQP